MYLCPCPISQKGPSWQWLLYAFPLGLSLVHWPESTIGPITYFKTFPLISEELLGTKAHLTKNYSSNSVEWQGHFLHKRTITWCRRVITYFIDINVCWCPIDNILIDLWGWCQVAPQSNETDKSRPCPTRSTRSMDCQFIKAPVPSVIHQIPKRLCRDHFEWVQWRVWSYLDKAVDNKVGRGTKIVLLVI